MLLPFGTCIHPSFQLEVATAIRICEQVDSPRSLAVCIMLRNQCWSELLDLEIDQSLYEDVGNFADDYLVTELMKKSKLMPTGYDLDYHAYQSFIKAETTCRETNNRLAGVKPDWFHITQSRVYSILGPLSTSDLHRCGEEMGFGPGATTGVRGSGSVMSDKYDEDIHLTSGLIPFYRAILGDRWWNHARDPEVVRGNRFTTVPKNAKTNRGICVEPTLNIFVQKGIGAVIRRKLKRTGIDINTQENNRRAAQQAYRRNYATIDLSMASDTVAWRTVLELLPNRWFELLDLARSPRTWFIDRWVELEKFSSMGNGYTFELQTVIFTAVCRTFVPYWRWDEVTVFGDDIICPAEYVDSIIDALNFLGLSVNRSKSFLAGSFFESCGADYFKGMNVRPFYLRTKAGDKTPAAVRICNQLRMYAHRRGCESFCDARFKPVWDWLVSLVPFPWSHCRVPVSYGDSGIVCSMSEARLPRSGGHLECRRTTFVIISAVRKRKLTVGLLLYKLHTLPRRSAWAFDSLADLQDPSYGFEPVRGYLGKVRTRTRAVYWPPEDSLSWM